MEIEKQLLNRIQSIMKNEIACKNQIRNLIKYLDEAKCKWFDKIGL